MKSKKMYEFYSKIKLYALHVQIIINSYCYNGTNKMTKEILLSLPKYIFKNSTDVYAKN